MAAQSVGLFFNETSGERRVVSELYPLPVSATFSGSVTIGSIDGDIAHDAPDGTSEPVKVGFKAEATTPAAVADNDRSNLSGTLYGAAFVNLRRASDGAEVGADSGLPLFVRTYDASGNAATTGISGLVDEVSPAVSAEGAVSYLRMTPTRDLRVCLTDSAGANIGTSGNYLFAATLSQGFSTHDDPVTVNGNPLLVGGFSYSAEPTAVSAAGDAVRAYFDLTGYQHVKSSGNVAHDAVDSGNPVKIGGIANAGVDTPPAAVGVGDRVNASFNILGQMAMTLWDRQGFSGTTNISGRVDDVSPQTLAEGESGPLRRTPTGDLHVNLRSQDGSELGTAPNPMIASAAIQGFTTHDDPGTNGNPVTIGGLGRSSEPTAVADNDTTRAYFDLTGYQHVKSSGNVAHDAVDSGNPVKVGGKAFSAVPAAVASADRVDATYTLNGAAHVQPTWQSQSFVHTATGNGTTVDASSSPKKLFSIQVTQTGGVTVWDVRVEGSNNGTDFTTIATHTNADTSGATIFAVDKPVLYFRSSVAGMTGGTSLTAVILGVA